MSAHGTGLRSAPPASSKFVKRAQSLYAVEFFGFPVHGELNDLEAIGGGRQEFALRGRPLAFGVGGGELALECGPLAAERIHEHGFDERFDVGFAGVWRAK